MWLKLNAEPDDFVITYLKLSCANLESMSTKCANAAHKLWQDYQFLNNDTFNTFKLSDMWHGCNILPSNTK